MSTKKNITGLSDSGKSMLPTERIPGTGAMKTPPPIRVGRANIAAEVKARPDSYGESGFAQASSDLPGTRTMSKWAAETEARNPDPVLAAIIRHDTRTQGHYAVDSGPDQWQTRPVSKTGIRPAENMKPDPNASGSPSGKVASGLVSDEEQPVRKPV